MAGRLGWGGGPGSGGLPVLFPPEPQMLQEREGELAQEPVVVQATPAPALEMVEAQLVLHLLVHLLADPTSLDQGRQDLERRIGRVIGQVVLPLAAGAMLADQPSLFTRKMLPFCGYRPVGRPYPDGGERGLKRAFGAGSPRDDTERGRPVLDQLSGSHARQRGHRMLARAAGRFALGEGERHIGGIDLSLPRPRGHPVKVRHAALAICS